MRVGLLPATSYQHHYAYTMLVRCMGDMAAVHCEVQGLW